MSMHGHAGYHDMHIAILRANQKYNLKKLLSGVFLKAYTSVFGNRRTG